MARSGCVTIQRTAITAACVWTAAILDFIVATVSAVWHEQVSAFDVALFGWGVVLVGAACVVSVKYLLDKQTHDTLDEVALLHQARDEAWRRAIDSGDAPLPPRAPVTGLPRQDHVRQ